MLLSGWVNHEVRPATASPDAGRVTNREATDATQKPPWIGRMSLTGLPVWPIPDEGKRCHEAANGGCTRAAGVNHCDRRRAPQAMAPRAVVVPGVARVADLGRAPRSS